MQTTKEAWRLDNLKTQPRMILIYRSLSDVVGFIREKRKNHICIGRESNVRISRNFEFCNEQVPLRAKFLIFFSYNSCNFYYCNNYLTTYFSSLFNNFNNFLEIKKKRYTRTKVKNIRSFKHPNMGQNLVVPRNLQF